MKRTACFLLWLVAAAAALSAAEKKPLTNADVVKMVKAELPDSTILLAIKNSVPAFDTTPDGLIGLRSAGVSGPVIDAMLQARQLEEGPVSDAPTEAEVERLIGSLAAEQSKRVIALAAFKKLDGQASQVNGVKVYKMDFEAYVTFSTDCVWTSLYMNMERRLAFEVGNRPQKGRSATEDLLNQATAAEGLHVNRGAVFLVKGQASLEKAERGWRLRYLAYSLIQPSTAQAAAAVSGRKNESRLRSAMSVSQEDLVRLVSAPLAATATPSQPFTSAGGLVSASFPAGFRIEKTQGSIVGRFVLADGHIPSDAITLQCTKLNGEQTLSDTVAATKRFISKQYPGATFTDTVDTKLAGADAQIFVMTVFEENTLKQKATTLAICRGHLVGVVLHSTPARFSKMWDAYRRVSESYVLNSN